jgi:hypothetical protein
MSKNQLLFEKFLPVLIFFLVSFVCIMAGWRIGTGVRWVSYNAVIRGVLLGLMLGSFLGFGSFGIATGWIWRKRYPNLRFKHFLLLTLGWMVIPSMLMVWSYYIGFSDFSDSAVFLVLLCFTLLVLILVGAAGGFVGGKISSRVLKELDSEISRETHAKIVEQSTLGFSRRFILGGILMDIGLLNLAYIPHESYSYQWALFVAVGFALMGSIGTTSAGSALFGKE